MLVAVTSVTSFSLMLAVACIQSQEYYKLWTRHHKVVKLADYDSEIHSIRNNVLHPYQSVYLFQQSTMLALKEGGLLMFQLE